MNSQGKAKGRLELSGPKIIKHTRFNELVASIEECQELSRRSGERKCMLLQGETGVGKTTLVNYYQQEFTKRYAVDDLSTPVLYMRVPAPVTVKALVAGMLATLNIRTATSRTLYNQAARLTHYLDTCGVQLVILDEFQHLVQHSGRSRNEVSDFIKNLIKETEIMFLLVGLDEASSADGTPLAVFLQENSQLSRLFARRETLQPFGTKSSKEFSAFLMRACQISGVEVSGMTQQQFRARTMACTGGVVSHIIDLLNEAVMEAEKSGSKQVSVEHLSLAFNKSVRPTNGRDDAFAKKS